jgi:hypothetical protein
MICSQMWVMYMTITYTRQSGADLILPKPKTNSMINAFSYRGAEVWNCLSASVKASTTIDRFHSRDRWPQWGGETIRNI